MSTIKGPKVDQYHIHVFLRHELKSDLAEVRNSLYVIRAEATRQTLLTLHDNIIKEIERLTVEIDKEEKKNNVFDLKTRRRIIK